MIRVAARAPLGERSNTATALVASPGAWPSNRRNPGIANGWHGAAWLAFQLAARGAPVPPRTFAAIARRLRTPMSDRPDVGAMIGIAADAVVAAYAVRHGDLPLSSARAACRRLVGAAQEAPLWDLHMGVSGALLALLEIHCVAPRALRDLSVAPLVARLRTTTDALCALPAHGWQTGLAHGPIGPILALESCAAAGWGRIDGARRQRWLDLLSRSALAPATGGLLWPVIAGGDSLGLQSWCAGTPGIALALLHCYRLSGEAVYLEVARDALVGALALFERPFFSPTLCCGSAGYGHIFIEAYRVTGERDWLEHAARPPTFAAAAVTRPARGLHQGALGVAYLDARLADPDGLPLPALGAASAGLRA